MSDKSKNMHLTWQYAKPESQAHRRTGVRIIKPSILNLSKRANMCQRPSQLRNNNINNKVFSSKNPAVETSTTLAGNIFNKHNTVYRKVATPSEPTLLPKCLKGVPASTIPSRPKLATGGSLVGRRLLAWNIRVSLVRLYVP